MSKNYNKGEYAFAALCYLHPNPPHLYIDPVSNWQEDKERRLQPIDWPFGYNDWNPQCTPKNNTVEGRISDLETAKDFIDLEIERLKGLSNKFERIKVSERKPKERHNVVDIFHNGESATVYMDENGNWFLANLEGDCDEPEYWFSQE